ncbi:hypothetical protein [Paenibacillus methanolicus]|uniref:Uncharacterized protein n=1 Tax=Paenibacillus methanolicus TaxID=582686 RepID=A0A5S5CFW3_9BACL|nr:hypothetical protein [Paenibacillus methanolicus]TYP78225.1 hypothetical protein BCM02_102802 [Paenibacillus methanolicus]
MFKWRWWLTGWAALLLLFSAPPIVAMGLEYAASAKVRNHFIIDRIYVNSAQPGDAEVLGEGTGVPISGFSLRNSLVHGGKTVAIRSLDDYARQIALPSDEAAVYERAYSWKGQSIRVTDRFLTGDVTRDSRAQSALQITINGVDWSTGGQAEVRPAYLDENRYHGYYGMLLVREEGEERLVLVQRADGVGFNFKPETLAWRMLSVDRRGAVTEQRVAYGEWKDQPELANYVNQSNATPVSVGYRSGILQVWPSLFFPILYPFASGGGGLLMLAAVGLSLPFRRRNSRERITE